MATATARSSREVLSCKFAIGFQVIWGDFIGCAEPVLHVRFVPKQERCHNTPDGPDMFMRRDMISSQMILIVELSCYDI